LRYNYLIILILFSKFALCQTSNRGASAENAASNSEGTTHVVLVGISAYKNLPESKQLDFADDDAELLSGYLKSQGDIRLKVFLNEVATNKDKIGREIQMTLLNEAQQGDEVIIYFAGHGDVDTLMNDGYLLLNQVEAPEVAPYSFNDAVSLTLIQRFINVSAEKRGIKVTFIADACHSGAVTSANDMISKINANVITITSCQKKEVSQESIEFGNGHGVFTYYLVQGLMGLADMDEDKVVDLMELEMYVKMSVSKRTMKAQNPVFSGSSNEPVALVNEELLKLAKKGENLDFQQLAALGKTKAISSGSPKIDGPCGALLQLLQEQAVESKFFPDELDSLDKLPITTGTSQAKKIHSKQVWAIAVSYDGSITASSSADGIALSKGKDIKQVSWLKGHSAEVTALSFCPGNKLLASGSADQSVVLWDAVSGEKLYSQQKISSPVTSILALSEKQILVGTEKGSLILWEPELDITREYKVHKGSLNDLVVDGQTVYTVGADGKLGVFDLVERKKVTIYSPGSDAPLNGIVLLTGSGQLLTAGDNGAVYKCSLDSKKSLNCKELKTDFGAIKDIAYDPFEKYAFIIGAQKKAAVIDLENLSLVKQKFSSISGGNALFYDPIYHQLKFAETDGSISMQEVKVLPEESSAVAIHDQLSGCDELKDQKYRIDGTLIIGLNNHVNEVLNTLVNGSPDPAGMAEIVAAKRYAAKAFELGSGYELDADKLEINLRLLEVYEILLSGNKEAFPAALEKVKRIEELDPTGAYLYNVAAELYARLEDSKKALELAQKAEQLAPKWSQASVNTGNVMLLTGDVKGAEQKFKEAITETPKESKGYTALGQLYLSQGKLEDARKNLETAFKLDSGAVALQSLQETMGRIEIANARGGAVSNGPVPLNVAFYRNYNNKLRLSASDYTTWSITASNASLTKKNNEYILRVSGPTTSVVISLTSTTTGKVLGKYEIPVRDLPKVELWWGSARPGDRMDVNADQFIYGYNPLTDPDLDNSMFKVVNYIVEFQDGGLRFNGQGPKIYDQLINEVKRSRKAGAKGGVCVGAIVQNIYGETFSIQGCYSF